MDYSVNGILVMLQDLQRIHFGKVAMYVDVNLSDDGEPIVSGCVFDGEGDPHTTTFYSFESDDRHREKYRMVLELINDVVRWTDW